MPIITGSNADNSLATKSDITFYSDNSSLYSFSSFTFTSAGISGRTGPTLAGIQSAYSSTSWTSNTSYLNIVGSGIQKWTVPKTGEYHIQVAGAPGGRASDYATGNEGVPGSGVILSANFWLVKNDILYILVGQKGGDAVTYGNGTNGFNSDTDGGGGGGTFVAKKVSSSQYYFTPDSCYVTPLIVAGGGNGGASDGRGLNAMYIGLPTGSMNDQWGYSTGGGFSSYPTDETSGISGLTSRINYGLSTGDASNYGGGGSNHPRPGSHFINGGNGGVSCSNLNESQGGFGGGGGATDEGGSGGGGWIGGVGSDGGGGTSASSFVSPNGNNISYDGYNSYSSATTPNGYCIITFYGQ